MPGAEHSSEQASVIPVRIGLNDWWRRLHQASSEELRERIIGGVQGTCGREWENYSWEHGLSYNFLEKWKVFVTHDVPLTLQQTSAKHMCPCCLSIYIHSNSFIGYDFAYLLCHVPFYLFIPDEHAPWEYTRSSKWGARLLRVLWPNKTIPAWHSCTGDRAALEPWSIFESAKRGSLLEDTLKLYQFLE